eukprot:10102486-Alexandrium_andersonii.AAC.1
MARKAAEVKRMPTRKPQPTAASLPGEADGAGIPRLRVPGIIHLVAAARSDPVRGLLGGGGRQPEHVNALAVEAGVAVGQVTDRQPCPRQRPARVGAGARASRS